MVVLWVVRTCDINLVFCRVAHNLVNSGHVHFEAIRNT